MLANAEQKYNPKNKKKIRFKEKEEEEEKDWFRSGRVGGGLALRSPERD